ncbi:DUF3575 domain-containing protein [Pedobacter frigoris]|uniref:DUF3575 domain-containing protein n=1 Tax=Pedobacter frigoris TaxID=2571272 RepID=UPI00292F183B|nr:DUF3575 domain-containing protein [Pedobacter frigoris]
MTKNSTKTFLILSLMAILGSASISQAQEKSADGIENRNLVKWNVGALLLKNFSFQYERAISKKISVAGGIRFAPKSGAPFKSKLEDLIDDPETWESIKDFKTGNFAFTPEVRFYLGKQVFQGFYVAPFVRYSTYSAEVPFGYDTDNGRETIEMSGDVTALTAGLLFGAQWKLSKQIHLDWWILGPNYGTSSGNILGKKSLNDNEQRDLLDALEDLDDLPLVKTKYTVDGNGAKVDFDGPWAGVRAGLSVGFRF